MKAQTAVNKLTSYLLGEDWYITDPVSNEQANDIIVHEILKKYSKRYNKEIKQKKKNKLKINIISCIKICYAVLSAIAGLYLILIGEYIGINLLIGSVLIIRLVVCK